MNLLYLLLFIAVAVVPLLAHRNADKLAARIRVTHSRMGNTEKNPGARKRQWQAKKFAAVLCAVITGVLELMAIHFVTSVEAAAFSALFAGGLGYILSRPSEQARYKELDAVATRIQSDPNYYGVVDAQGIVGDLHAYTKEPEPIRREGHGTGGVRSGVQTDLVDHALSSQMGGQ